MDRSKASCLPPPPADVFTLVLLLSIFRALRAQIRHSLLQDKLNFLEEVTNTAQRAAADAGLTDIFLGADSSKTRKHVMPENVLSENYVLVSKVKPVLHSLRPAQSMKGRNVLDFRPTL